MNLTREQRDLIIETLRNDASTMNKDANKQDGSTKRILQFEANKRILLASELANADAFHFNAAADKRSAT